jgi:hypothetical protein
VTAAAAAVLAALLVALAALQYHWASQLAHASEERARGALAQAASAFAGDFDRELVRLLFQFREVAVEDADAELARRAAAWRRQALYPELLRNVLRIRREGDGSLALLQLDEKQGVLVPASWPPELLPVRDALLRAGGTGPWPEPLVADAPAWLVALPPREGGPRWGLREELMRGELHGATLTDWAVLWMDEPTLRRELLPALAERHFGGAVEYRLEVRDAHGALVYARGPAVANGHPDATVPLFRMLGMDHFRRRMPHREDGGPPPLPLHRDSPPSPPRHESPPASGWTLQVTHPEGSVAAAAARVRLHNVAMSLTMVGLLAAAITLVLLAARRAQALARRQIELVAGVSHELLTPVAALRSAGENLATGVVREPEQVRAYGELVEREGRRLGTLVEQVLTWAGLQARARARGAPSGRRCWARRGGPRRVRAGGAARRRASRDAGRARAGATPRRSCGARARAAQPGGERAASRRHRRLGGARRAAGAAARARRDERRAVGRGSRPGHRARRAAPSLRALPSRQGERRARRAGQRPRSRAGAADRRGARWPRARRGGTAARHPLHHRAAGSDRCLSPAGRRARACCSPRTSRASCSP